MSGLPDKAGRVSPVFVAYSGARLNGVDGGVVPIDNRSARFCRRVEAEDISVGYAADLRLSLQGLGRLPA